MQIPYFQKLLRCGGSMPGYQGLIDHYNHVRFGKELRSRVSYQFPIFLSGSALASKIALRKYAVNSIS
jgi:hypothetical protein